MNNRELFNAVMRHENGDQLLHFELGFNVPYKKWYKQGMPSHVQSVGWAEITEKENLFDHFNVTGLVNCGVINQFCVPAFEEKTISDDGKKITFINSLGNTLAGISDKVQQTRDDGANVGSPPAEIAYAIKSLEDYERERYRYTGNIEKRYNPAWLKAHAAPHRDMTDFIPTLWVHGPFAYLRELIGTEMAMMAPYEDPDWVRMMLEDHLKTAMAAAKEPIRAIKHQVAFVWEDCCGSTGSFIAPAVFDEQFAWWYREWKDYTKNMGIPWTMMDTDGDPTPLVSRWFENGIDCMHPWEVNGVDMLKVAEQYPNYIMMGGIYKHMFEPNDMAQLGRFNTSDVHMAIDQELERVVKPMRKRGGYFPSLDHWAFWGIEYDDYRYYCDRMLDYGKANVSTRNFLQ
ncbi:hypothetical protein AGMMS4952_05500 [Spirochaetia bacterium]|nr:hypothetical protein AGMMS4952_05500 [Spirochaetia bacterium]